MIVTSQNRVLTVNGNRILVNDPIDYFLGYVDDKWNNPLNWSLGIVPTNSHVAYIFANCTMNTSNAVVKGLVVETGYTINCLYSITIGTNLEVYGTMLYAQGITLQNTVTTFIQQGTFAYTNSTDQLLSVQGNLTLPPNLVLPSLGSGQSNITMGGDLTVMGDFTPNNTPMEVGPYNLTIMGTCSVNSGGIKKNSGTGRVLLAGKVTANSGGRFFGTMTGNPVVEMRGGMDFALGIGGVSSTNDFTILCTTNDQVFNIAALASLTCTNFIADGVAVTINDQNTTPISSSSSSSQNYAQGLLVKGVVDGTSSRSSVTINTRGAGAPMLNAGNAPMATAGSFALNNADGNRNAVFFVPVTGTTIHPWWGNSFDYLYVSNQGLAPGTTVAAVAAQSFTISKALDVRGLTRLDMGSNNLTVLGTTYINYQGSTAFYAGLNGSGSGSWLFGGPCTFGRSSVTLTGATTSLEFRGGITTEDPSTSGNVSYDLGGGTVSFTTNDQVFNLAGVKALLTNLVIGSGITLTVVSNQQGVGNSTAGNVLISGSMEGVDAGSRLVNKGYITWATPVLPMNTGVLDTYGNPNVFAYLYTGAAAVKGGTYWHLSISNTSSTTGYTKTVTGDLVVLGDYRQANNANVTLGAFNLSVLGAGTVASTLNKTGTGTILFTGAVVMSTAPVLAATGPVLEFRGGLSYTASNAATWGQQVRFATNNQVLAFTSITTQPINILVDSGITLTLNTSGSFICTGSINGVDATATLVNTGSIDFRAAGGIMLTGRLLCDTVANTVIYNTTLGQTIVGPADGNYRTLTLTGNPSTKTVGSPGTVNVRGVYTKGAGVTVVGTITNNP